MTSDFTSPPPLAPPPPAPVPPPGSAARRAPTQQGMTHAARAVIWLSIVAAIALVAGLSYAVWLEVDQSRLAPASRTDTGTMATMRLVDGMCLADPVGPDGPVSTVTVVACTEPHHAEVVATLDFTQPDWPGVDRIRSDSLAYCARALMPGAGILERDLESEGLTWVAWVPSAATWSSGDRSAACVVSRESPMTGSYFSGTADPQ